MTTFVAPTGQDRALAAFRKLVLSVIPAARYWVTHEYSVASSDGITFSGTPTDATFSPALPVGVPYAPALAGAYAVVPVGTLAYVGFANADPAKPYLVRFAMGAPTATTIDASASVNVGASATAVVLANASPVATSPSTAASERRVVCYGDSIVVGLTAGAITLAPASTCSKVRA